MLTTCDRTERPRDLYCSLTLESGVSCVGEVGGCEAPALAGVEPTLKYHPWHSGFLTSIRYPDQEQCLAGSFTGAVAS